MLEGPLFVGGPFGPAEPLPFADFAEPVVDDEEPDPEPLEELDAVVPEDFLEAALRASPAALSDSMASFRCISAIRSWNSAVPGRGSLDLPLPPPPPIP